MDVQLAFALPLTFFEDWAGWDGNEGQGIEYIGSVIRTPCVKGGQKPCNVSSLARSWTVVDSRDFKSLVTYFSLGALVVDGVSDSCEAVGASE